MAGMRSIPWYQWVHIVAVYGFFAIFLTSMATPWLITGPVVVAFVTLLLFAISCVRRKHVKEPLQAGFWFKLLTIPFFIINFYWSVMSVGSGIVITFMWFGVPFLWLTDVFTMLSSSVIIMQWAKTEYRKGTISSQERWAHTIAQCIFCADVVSAIVLKRKYSTLFFSGK